MIDGHDYIGDKRLEENIQLHLLFNFYQLLDGEKDWNQRSFACGKYLSEMDRRVMDKAGELVKEYIDYHKGYLDYEALLKLYDDSCSTDMLFPCRNDLAMFMSSRGWEAFNEK